MIAPNFKYHAPMNLQDVFALMSEFGSDAKLLAGGHSLLPMMKFRFAEPAHLIDLGNVEGLKGIEVTEESLTIGAMTSENDLLRYPDMINICPLLDKAVRLIADPQIRNRGTIGGDIAHGDPANDQPSIMLALDATFVLSSSSGNRKLKADQFFIGTYETALQSGELLSKIIIPRAATKKRYGFRKLKRKTGDFATAACALTLTLEGKQCRDVRIALTNLGPKSFRAERAEWLLNSQPLSDDSINAAIHLAMEDCEPAEDQRGNSEYKIKMAGEMLKRALSDAIA
ncbi:xanthine dehydrogenase family protein subunit M [Alteromonas sp. 5E99-2]|uniref:FAD binding domain-containing protein n=1 Tax=Alteromonas sp. 5E99-2 TaxID=2817683 RepID=UPI001A99CDB9|nr:xanthine dehydrogenase family protein subunit M [Alteromonas sp. 5E99-2]MBO1256149.1 xanthine dehydrogenase family protein subunit M [Alteromonas sp. 5E99-2]